MGIFRVQCGRCSKFADRLGLLPGLAENPCEHLVLFDRLGQSRQPVFGLGCPHGVCRRVFLAGQTALAEGQSCPCLRQFGMLIRQDLKQRC